MCHFSILRVKERFCAINYCFHHSTNCTAQRSWRSYFYPSVKRNLHIPIPCVFLPWSHLHFYTAKCPIKYMLFSTHTKWVYRDVGVLREATREWSPSLDLSAATTQVSLPTLPVGRVQPNPLRAGLSLCVWRSLWHTVDFNTNSTQRKSKRSETRKYKGKRKMRGQKKKFLFVSLSLLLLRGYLSKLTSHWHCLKTCWFISFLFVCVCVGSLLNVWCVCRFK